MNPGAAHASGNVAWLLAAVLLFAGCTSASDSAPTGGDAPQGPGDPEHEPVDLEIRHVYAGDSETSTFGISQQTDPLEVGACFEPVGPGDAARICRGSDARIVTKDPTGGTYVDIVATGVSASIGPGGNNFGGKPQKGVRLVPGT